MIPTRPDMREDEIEWPIVKGAEKQGWGVRKIQWIGRKSAPDRMFFKAGRIVFIEFKRPGEEPRQDQAREIKRLLDQKLEAYAIDSKEQACEVLNLDPDQVE